jgi:hypothetical protein
MKVRKKVNRWIGGCVPREQSRLLFHLSRASAFSAFSLPFGYASPSSDLQVPHHIPDDKSQSAFHKHILFILRRRQRRRQEFSIREIGLGHLCFGRTEKIYSECAQRPEIICARGVERKREKSTKGHQMTQETERHHFSHELFV